MTLHEELHRNYLLISQLAVLCIRKNLRLIIENPITQPHYLTLYWCLQPKVIDKDRTLNGDYMKKPTHSLLGIPFSNVCGMFPVDGIYDAPFPVRKVVV